MLIVLHQLLLFSSQDATELLSVMTALDPPFEIDHSRLSFGYARKALGSDKKHLGYDNDIVYKRATSSFSSPYYDDNSNFR